MSSTFSFLPKMVDLFGAKTTGPQGCTRRVGRRSFGRPRRRWRKSEMGSSVSWKREDFFCLLPPPLLMQCAAVGANPDCPLLWHPDVSDWTGNTGDGGEDLFSFRIFHVLAVPQRLCFFCPLGPRSRRQKGKSVPAKRPEGMTKKQTV